MDKSQMEKSMATSVELTNQSGQVSACIKAFKQIETSNHPGIILREFVEGTEQAWFAQNNSARENDIHQFLSTLEGKANEDNAVKTQANEALASVPDILYYLSNYTKLVERIIDFYATQGYDEDVYYEKLWSALYAVTRDAQEIEKGVALYAVLLDRRMPYCFLGKGMRMSDEQYKEITDELSEPLKRFLYALSLNFNQKTEFASIILSILQAIPSEEKQTVFLSQMITILKQSKA